MASLHPVIPIDPLVSPFLLGQRETVAVSMDLCSLEDYCIEWLDKKLPSSVIYISLGSIIVMTHNQIDSIATTLRKSDRPFVWVIKPPEKGSSKKSGYGLLHDSGWISTLKTIVAGMPVIAYLEWTNQSIDAKLLVDVLKIGVRMRNGKDEALGAEEVERCIMEMTDETTATHMKKRAIALKEAAKKAVEDGGSSYQNINNFINEIKGKSL
ncbi:hypothetical protein Patl1_28608 [Pistacia atlantica]|uniref:Uncharacterized protein n=1 Tax=Pistacia atlantica TaxID=434234 RepID=A0ACC1BFV3_9ROSI|nr:hypothetical protein Patl1_28608 [Pistacia atlantica]